ncbi:hypothetical protein HNR75_002299 [Tolumonas osonensis]|uniref:Uncharacterized protein n=1 Tax=Tolumonas osonensis TaxID=675874 RepID=A0A841GFL1_9GAMM|nr:hypothetical protein [Tolumonas osonensis]
MPLSQGLLIARISGKQWAPDIIICYILCQCLTFFKHYCNCVVRTPFLGLMNE